MKSKGCVFEGKRFWSPDTMAPASGWPDTSRFRNNGAFVNNPTWLKLPSGLWATSFLAASSQTVSIPTHESLNTYRVTIEAWFRCDAHRADQRCVFGLWQFPVRIDLLIGLTGYLGFTMRDSNNVVNGISFSGFTVDNGIWHHVASSFDGSNLNLVVDGIAAVSVPYAPTGNFNSTNPRYWVCRGGIEYFFWGEMILARMHRYALPLVTANSHFEAERRFFGV